MTGITNMRPSPISPVRAASVMALTASSTIESGHDDFNLHLRQQADVVFLATIDGRVALLLAVAPDLGHGHPRDLEPLQRALHFIHLVRPHDRLDQLHGRPSRTRCKFSVSCRCCSADSLFPSRCQVKHVDRAAPFGGDQHQIDVAARLGHGPAHTVEQAERIFRHDLDDGVARRGLVVAVDDRRESGQPAPKTPFFAALQARRQIGPARGSRPRARLTTCASPPWIQLQEPFLVAEMEHVHDEAVGLGEGEAAQDVHAERGQHA